MKTIPPKIVFFAAFYISCTTLGFTKSKQDASAWIGTWATSQQVTEPTNRLSADDLRDATLRQIIHLTVGGESLRVHISNAFGTTPLHLTLVHIARPLSPSEAKIDGSTDQALTFFGKNDTVIPAGAEYVSDPVAYRVAALSDLTISLHIDTPPEQQTGHPGSRSSSYLSHGDLVSAADLPNAKMIERWYWIAGGDVNAARKSSAIVVLGDSITDGHGATTNGNVRGPDVLARKLQANHKTRMLAVLNQGIGGNHLLTDGLGPNALSRVDRDIIAQAGVRYLIVLEGVNDLGKLSREDAASQAEHEALVQQMTAAYEQIIVRAH